MGMKATRGVAVSYTRLPLGWNGGYTQFTDPLSYIGHDGGAGVGSGPGMTIGVGLALKGTGRVPISVMGDGDFLMGNTALWTAVHYRIPLLIVQRRLAQIDILGQRAVTTALKFRPLENRPLSPKTLNRGHSLPVLFLYDARL